MLLHYGLQIRMIKMKHIDIESYLQAAAASEEAWNVANDKLEEFELKIKELTVIKAQIKTQLDNTSMASSILRSLILDLEKFYGCICGNFESHPIHSSKEPLQKNSHAYTSAFEIERITNEKI